MTEKDKQSGSILVVDDEESLRNTFHFFLSREGYDPVITTPTFDEALSVLQERSVDLIVSDIVLEASTGIDLLKQTRKMGIDCPFIIITGYPEVETAAEAVRLGAFDYLSKPVDKETLLRSVRLALRQRWLETQKTMAEKERERYRIFLDKVFKSVTDAIMIVDSEMKIIKLNAAAQFLFTDLLPGIKEGTCLSESITSDEFSHLHTDLLRVLKTGREVSEHRFECKTIDNKPKILSICTSPFQEDKENTFGAVVVIRDMSIQEEQRQQRRHRFHRFIGACNAMQMVYTTIENVGKVDTTVLITGESGTGKELAAEALHQESPRKDKPLIKVDCTAMPESLLESELFGHRKGSFTGADKDRMGHILQADGGTLFLDEIGEISALTQLRLLRFLQEKTFYPVGSDTPIIVDTRVITATNVDLKEKVQEGSFREDLYFRLRVIDLSMPPLRERENDIILLANHFVAKFSEKLGKKVNGFSDNTLEKLLSYHWPGNVRELEHVVERAVVLCNGAIITTDALPSDLTLDPDTDTASAPPLHPPYPIRQAEPSVIDNEDPVVSLILQTLSKCGGNKAKAARLLGMDRSTLYRKIKEYSIDLSVIALE